MGYPINFFLFYCNIIKMCYNKKKKGRDFVGNSNCNNSIEYPLSHLDILLIKNKKGGYYAKKLSK